MLLRYGGVFLVSAVTVAAVTPIVRRVAVRFGAIDHPSDRKIHPKPTPTGGGVAILLGILAGLAVAYVIPPFHRLFARSLELQGTMMAATVIAAIGLYDDVRNLSAPAKLAGQILAAGLLILNGVQLLFFWFPSQGIISLGSDLAQPLTVLWVLLLVNAINLIDGLDGLAAGIVFIAAAAFFTWVFTAPSTFVEGTAVASLLSAVVAGAAVGFLPYNFHPARIFMGDSGSMVLGLVLASATISGVGRTIRPSGGDLAAFSIPVLIPAIVLAVPLMDVALAIVRRLRKHRAIYAPDKEHLHHQLREIGHTHRQAVLLLYLWSVLLAGSGLAVSFINGRVLVGAILAGALLLIALTFVPRRIRETRRRRAEERRAVQTGRRAAKGAGVAG